MSKVQAAQLLARGVQDVWLSGDPQVSFYRSNFKRHVPFAMTIERFIVPRDGRIVINSKSDLLGYTYLTAHDPTSGALVPNADWSNIISTVELVIGNQTIATHDITYINVIQKVLEAETYSKRSSTFFQPLGFFFDRQALPLVALKYTDVKINITWASSIAATQYLYRCWSYCIHLGEDERQFFVNGTHQMLIPKLQRTIIKSEPSFYGPLKYIAAPCVNYINMYSPPPLYPFTSFTFTNMDATSNIGPTSITYGGSTPGYGTPYVMTLSGGIQYWTVPATKTWNFTVAGAGSTAPASSDSIKTAYGVVMTDSYNLSEGQVVAILVGHQGLLIEVAPFGSTSGSGGTFVCIYSNGTYTPLFIAGGAGGIGNEIGTNLNVDASTGINGRTPNMYVIGQAGGTNGNGATGPTSFASGGTSAGGFYTSGTRGTTSGYPANGFLQGGQGGYGGAGSGRNGGFGGGGGGGNQAGGGGGGYSGGAPGTRGSNGSGGAGGGSYSINNPSGPVTGSATNSGMGYVTVD